VWIWLVAAGALILVAVAVEYVARTTPTLEESMRRDYPDNEKPSG
jgi:hypothetical protein